MELNHAASTGWQLGSCPWGDCDYLMFNGLPWADCGLVTPTPGPDIEEGNLVCEHAPQTADYDPESSGGRSEAVAWFVYDEHGRMTYTHNLDGSVVQEDYVDIGTGMIKTVSRLGDGDDEPIQTRYTYDLRGQNTKKEMAIDTPFSTGGACIVEDFYYYGLGRLTETTISRDFDCSLMGAEIVEKREKYEYDGAGNVTSSTTYRCPGDPWMCTAEEGTSSVSDDELSHIKLYDSKRRVTWDCKEFEFSAGGTGTTHVTCTVNGYSQDDKVTRVGHLDSCDLRLGEGNPPLVEQLGSCVQVGMDPSWDAFRFVTEYGYDERRLQHRTRVYDPTLSSADDRISRVYHDVDGRAVASHDAADSDGLYGPEWAIKEYDGLGRVARSTIGLDGPVVSGEGIATGAPG